MNFIPAPVNSNMKMTLIPGENYSRFINVRIFITNSKVFKEKIDEKQAEKYMEN